MKRSFLFTRHHKAKWLGLIACAALGASNSFAGSPAWLTAHDAEIKELVSRMTLEEKAGQMTQPNVSDLKDLSEIEKLSLGSVFSAGSTDPKTGNHLSE